MRLIFSVVSHYHHDIIITLATLKSLNNREDVEIICRDNHSTGKLRTYCEQYGLHYISNKKEQGFAANNNANFTYYQEHLSPCKDDYFVMLNPDVIFTEKACNRLIKYLRQETGDFLYTTNMYHDREYMTHDDNIRYFPKFTDFLKTYLFKKRVTMIDRTEGLAHNGQCDEYWASCAFLILKADLYKQLRGLNERFYLYCEDIEFSNRAIQQGYKIKLIEEVKAIHLRQRKSRNFFSSHFRMHTVSVFKYQLTKLGLLSFKSRL